MRARLFKRCFAKDLHSGGICKGRARDRARKNLISGPEQMG